MSSQLLTEIAGMSASSGGGGSGGGKLGKAAAAAAAVVGKGGGGGGGGGAVKKPLIEEVKASHTVRVERGEGGVPTAVEVSVFLPALSCVADANLELSDRYVHLTPGAGAPEMVIALPVQINPEAVSAKFKKEKKRLTLKLEPSSSSATSS